MPIALLPATKDALFWARERVIKGHYLHTVPDPRSQRIREAREAASVS